MEVYFQVQPRRPYSTDYQWLELELYSAVIEF
jgi:hypothetical protein